MILQNYEQAFIKSAKQILEQKEYKGITQLTHQWTTNDGIVMKLDMNKFIMTYSSNTYDDEKVKVRLLIDRYTGLKMEVK